MRIQKSNPEAPTRQRSRLSVAFTLAELLVSMAIFTLAISGLISVQIMGLRMNEWAAAKLGASNDARGAISRMVTEIRSAGELRIGNGNLNGFTEIGLNQPQRGNAIQIHPLKGADTNFVRYYWDPTDRRLKRTENGAAAATIVANSISNSMVFTSEDYQGNILSNNFNNRVIGVTLQFYQLQYPRIEIGPNSLYDFYQLRTRITRRALE